MKIDLTKIGPTYKGKVVNSRHQTPHGLTSHAARNTLQNSTARPSTWLVKNRSYHCWTCRMKSIINRCIIGISRNSGQLTNLKEIFLLLQPYIPFYPNVCSFQYWNCISNVFVSYILYEIGIFKYPLLFEIFLYWLCIKEFCFVLSGEGHAASVGINFFFTEAYFIISACRPNMISMQNMVCCGQWCITKSGNVHVL